MATHKEAGLIVKKGLIKSDPDYYRKLGALGGKTPKTKPSGFAYIKLHNPEQLSALGRKGGHISRRPRRSNARTI